MQQYSYSLLGARRVNVELFNVLSPFTPRVNHLSCGQCGKKARKKKKDSVCEKY